MRALAAVASLVMGCHSPSFTPSNEVTGLRVLAIRADQPIAPPGATVNLDALVVDGRTPSTAPVQAAWFPEPCINPEGDAYYACFSGVAGQFAPYVDLSDQLQMGGTLTVSLPPDIVASHATRAGQHPYGVAIVFAVACRGHVEYRPELGAGAPDAVPFGCFDAMENRLGPDDFVFAFARVYASADRTNANPQVDGITKDGVSVDVDAGFSVSRCTNSSLLDCPTTSIDVSVPSSSQEPDPDSLDRQGNPLKEEIWVDYYVTGTRMTNDAVVLYDPSGGAVSGTGDPLYLPQVTGDQRLWAVVHDDRGGVNWLETTIHAQ